MSTYLKSILLFIVIIISCQSVKAQHTEAGLVAKASSGFIYGPVFNARPLYKWGASFESVRTLRAERTYLHYSQYGGNQYGSASTGGFFGQEWRKKIRAGLYLIQGPEIGGYYTTTGPYLSVQPRINYQFGVLYRLTPKVNIVLSSPISSGISLESSSGSNWDRTLFTFDVFNDMNTLSLTYIL